MSRKVRYSWKWVDDQINEIGEQLEGTSIPKFVTGVPRGGLIPAVLISHKFKIPYIGLEAAKTLPGELKKQVLVIDDISDSGNTLKQIERHNFITATLAVRNTSDFIPTMFGDFIKDDRWIVFPWEEYSADSIQDYLADPK